MTGFDWSIVILLSCALLLRLQSIKQAQMGRIRPADQAGRFSTQAAVTAVVVLIFRFIGWF